MIVKLTYSAELDEVPSEVGRILSHTNTEMSELCRELESVAGSLQKSEPDVKSSLSRIEHTLKFLDKLDAKLKDCQSILSGYLSVLEQQSQPAQTTSQQEDEAKATKKTTKKE